MWTDFSSYKGVQPAPPRTRRQSPSLFSLYIYPWAHLVIGKSHRDALLLDLLLEQIPFVEENDEGHILKVLVVDHFVEKCQTFLHSQYIYQDSKKKVIHPKWDP